MATSQNLDRSLDEILAERQPARRGRNNNGNANGNTNGNTNGGGGRRRERERVDNYPRDGVRKSYRDDSTRSLDSEWVHDRYDDNGGRRRARSPLGAGDSRGSGRLRVENLHYDLTEDDLTDLFERIGPVTRLELRYDRSGRSDGIAYVTFESIHDARRAIQEYDGANAAGQPIRISLVNTGPANRTNNSINAGRKLAERITAPGQHRSRSLSPGARNRRSNYDEEDEEAARKGIDRYRPGSNPGSRVSPQRGAGRREGGRRPGARRDQQGDGRGRSEGGRGGGGVGGGGVRTAPRPKKTTEELDAEMADYFGGGGGGDGTAAPVQQEQSGAMAMDVDMIE